MKVTYIHHSCFLVETDRCYYLFDYEQGDLPQPDAAKPLFVFSSHAHHDHYNPEVFAMLDGMSVQTVYAVLSEDIEMPVGVDGISVAAGREYRLPLGRMLTTLKSTDEGVAFLLSDGEDTIYHAGDLNDWVWAEETAAYNHQMTKKYREQIDLLCQKLDGRQTDVAFVVLDPRQEQDYDRGMCYFLERIPAKTVYPMHYWGKPQIVDAFLEAYPQYAEQIQKPE